MASCVSGFYCARYISKRDKVKYKYFRYAIYDVCTKKVVDDAQGFGYKSEEKAWNSFKWKRR